MRVTPRGTGIIRSVLVGAAVWLLIVGIVRVVTLPDATTAGPTLTTPDGTPVRIVERYRDHGAEIRARWSDTAYVAWALRHGVVKVDTVARGSGR